MIEGFGVPHVAVELVVVNGESSDFSRLVRDGDRVGLYPVFESVDVTPVSAREEAQRTNRPARATRIFPAPTPKLARNGARIHELKTTFAQGVIQLEIRQRSARVQILQNQLNRMCRLVEARAPLSTPPPRCATGLLVRDYRGKNAEREVWKFDAALVAQLNEVLKQAAIEEGQWTDKRGSQAA
jgi:hypothetical protein